MSEYLKTIDVEDEDDLFEAFLPVTWLEHYHQIPPEYFEMPDKELERLAYGKANYSHKTGDECRREDDQLREKFWYEHEYATRNRTRIKSAAVYGNIIHRASFLRIMRDCKARFATILRPPGDYMAQNAQVLRKSIERIMEVLARPIVIKVCRCMYDCQCWRGKRVPPGTIKRCKCCPLCICPEKTDTKLADTISRIKETFDLRVKGSIPMVQKVQSINLHQHQQIPAPAAPLPTSVEDVDKKMKELEAMTNTPALTPGEDMPIEVMFVEEDKVKV